jgi:DNA polymerase III subunit epsilon
MRQIILDTETTGLDPALGHRIIEIAAVEICNRRFTDRHYQQYINPQREIDAGAMEVHGISSEFLADKPKFRDIAGTFIDFVAGAELIIHNAPFDVGFLDHELALLDLKPIRDYCPVITDTLKLAKSLHPGKRNSLDALCERYQIDNAARTLHGALLDARLLAEVYLAMTRGQESLLIDMGEAAPRPVEGGPAQVEVELVVLRASPDERAAHAAQIDGIDKAGKVACIWKKLAS